MSEDRTLGVPSTSSSGTMYNLLDDVHHSIAQAIPPYQETGRQPSEPTIGEPLSEPSATAQPSAGTASPNMSHSRPSSASSLTRWEEQSTSVPGRVRMQAREYDEMLEARNNNDRSRSPRERAVDEETFTMFFEMGWGGKILRHCRTGTPAST